jgi:hypothetical protein
MLIDEVNVRLRTELRQLIREFESGTKPPPAAP